MPATPTSLQALAWSEAVNRSIAEIVRDVPPFPSRARVASPSLAPAGPR